MSSTTPSRITRSSARKALSASKKDKDSNFGVSTSARKKNDSKYSDDLDADEDDVMNKPIPSDAAFIDDNGVKFDISEDSSSKVGDSDDDIVDGDTSKAKDDDTSDVKDADTSKAKDDHTSKSKDDDTSDVNDADTSETKDDGSSKTKDVDTSDMFCKHFPFIINK